MTHRLLLFMAIAAALSLPFAARADCVNPAGTEGTVMYNADYKVPQFCDGATWWAMKSGGGLPSCADGETIIMASSGWACGSGGGIIPGYLVRTDDDYNGNLGGLSGADAICLSELQTYDWKGKSEAGTLTSGRVKAWLCDSSTCNDFVPDSIYIMAKADSTTTGGEALYVAADGSGPNDGAYWNGGSQLTGATYWTGRSSISNFLWGLTPDGDTCSDWSTTSGEGMRGLSYIGNDGRWSDGILACSNTQELLCMVHPEGSDPDPDPCADNPDPGDACADGSIYAGLSPDGNVKMYTTPADEGGIPWNNGNGSGFVTTSQTSAVTGEANTGNLITIDSDSGAGGTQPHQAAQACADLSAHGQTDWYLPAKDELNVLYTNRAAIGGFNTSGSYPAGLYWSSSEDNSFRAWRQNFSNSVQSVNNKDGGVSVRCVRR
jgi:hypothetical protein